MGGWGGACRCRELGEPRCPGAVRSADFQSAGRACEQAEQKAGEWYFLQRHLDGISSFFKLPVATLS